jgi:hypothetical protein
MPWAGPWWRTVTAQVIGRYFGEAQCRRRTRRGPRPYRIRFIRDTHNVSTTVPKHAGPWPVARAGGSVWGARAWSVCVRARRMCTALNY